MTRDRWAAVDDYFDALFIPADPALEAALGAPASAGLPPINVSPTHGKLLHLLARLRGARSILEIGTLAGYSTMWLARALPPDGRLITLEIDPKHAAVAEANLARAGLAGRVDLRVGQALELLPRLAAEGAGPFDLVFIDADKPNNPAYVTWALRLARPGTLIVVDNAVRDGAILDAATEDPSIRAIREMHERLAEEPRLSVTAIQTVGAKGYDGLVLALVLAREGERFV